VVSGVWQNPALSATTFPISGHPTVPYSTPECLQPPPASHSRRLLVVCKENRIRQPPSFRWRRPSHSNIHDLLDTRNDSSRRKRTTSMPSLTARRSLPSL
jgi:hypothetical protein